MLIKVGVFCFDGNGDPSIYTTTVNCTEKQIDNSEHYEIAKKRAEDEGYEPRGAFDETDSAAKRLGEDVAFFKGPSEETHYLIVVEGDVEPTIDGPFATEDERAEAKCELKANGFDGGIYGLDIDAKGSPTVFPYSGECAD